MNPRKNRPVLYELVARTQRSRPATSPAPTLPPSTSRPVTPTPEPAATPWPEAEGGPPRRSVRFADGRVQLTLGWPELAVAGVLLVVLLVVMFQAGARSAQPSAPQSSDSETLFGDSQSVAVKERPADETAEHRPRTGAGVVPIGLGSGEDGKAGGGRPGGGERGDVGAGQPGEPTGLEHGRYYVYVQYFPKDKRPAAQDAQRFLREKGVACVLDETRLDVVLIAEEPFASEADDRAKELAARIRELGKAYRKAGGNYDFKGCLIKKY